jgi:hypothetical protein
MHDHLVCLLLVLQRVSGCRRSPLGPVEMPGCTYTTTPESKYQLVGMYPLPPAVCYCLDETAACLMVWEVPLLLPPAAPVGKKRRLQVALARFVAEDGMRGGHIALRLPG